MLSPRAFGLLTYVGDDLVMIGGHDPFGGPVSSVEVLDDGGWRLLANLDVSDQIGFSNNPGRSCLFHDKVTKNLE